MRFIFGSDRIGQDVVIDESVNNVLITGKREKRNEFYSWLIGNAMVSDEVDYVLVSKNEDLLKNAEPYKTYNKNYVVAFEQLFNEMERRYEILSSHNVRTIDEFNRNDNVNMKRILLLVDEIEFIRDKKDALQGFIIPILQKGRAVGIHLIIGTNRKRESYFFHAISMNCSSKFYFEEDEKESLEYIESKFGVSIDEIIEYVKEHGAISISYFQRRYCMGYPKAAQLMDLLVKVGIIASNNCKS